VWGLCVVSILLRPSFFEPVFVPVHHVFAVGGDVVFRVGDGRVYFASAAADDVVTVGAVSSREHVVQLAVEVVRPWTAEDLVVACGVRAGKRLSSAPIRARLCRTLDANFHENTCSTPLGE
jgi:hypothetical protein